MLYEYAVEPSAITEDWKTCRYLSELFGFDRGRLLSQFPKKWLAEALNSTEHLSTMDRHRVEEKLRRLKESAAVRSGRSYDASGKDWTQNAIAQQAAAPFRAIIASNDIPSEPTIVIPDHVSEDHPLFTAPRSAKIPRKASEISAILTPLISCSHISLLVDKYYDPFNNRYQLTLRDLLVVASRHSVDFEIHYCEHGRCPDSSDIEREANRKFRGVIPAGMTVRLYRWRERSGGMNFHARYLLTNRGGVRIDAGFSSEGEGHETDIELLETRFATDRANELKPGEGPFELVGPVLQIDEHGDIASV